MVVFAIHFGVLGLEKLLLLGFLWLVFSLESYTLPTVAFLLFLALQCMYLAARDT